MKIFDTQRTVFDINKVQITDFPMFSNCSCEIGNLGVIIKIQQNLSTASKREIGVPRISSEQFHCLFNQKNKAIVSQISWKFRGHIFPAAPFR